MNGFIMFTGTRNAPAVDPERIVPIVEGIRYELRHLRSGDYLLTWGSDCGDICFAEQTGKAILILSGYITEVDIGVEFESQAQAAAFLLSELTGATSVKEIERLVSRINGSFGIVFRDYSRDRTICITDRMSSRPLWQYRDGSSMFVSTHVSAIALSVTRPRIDPAALGSFMLYGGPVVPARTLFQGIEAIPTASIVVSSGDGSGGVKEWYRFRHQDDTGLSINEWTELLAERLIHAATHISRHCRNPAVFFSGGTDSRLAASAMKSVGSSPLLVTLADGINLEVRVAKLAAKALGLDHTVIIRDPYWYLRRLRNTVYETGGSYVWTHGHFSGAAELVRKEHGADVLMLGDFCEAFSKLLCAPHRFQNALWTPEEFRQMFNLLRPPLYRPLSEDATLSLFNKETRNEIEERLGLDIEQRYRRICGLSHDPRVVCDLYFRWETVTSMPTFFMFLDLREMAAERNVMFDRGVHELLERLPSSMRNNRNLGARVIKRLQPAAAWVMNSNSLLPMIWPPLTHKMSRRIKPVLGRLRRLYLGRTHRTTGSWPEHSALYVSDSNWRRCFESILQNGELFDAELFDFRAIRRCWEDLSNGDKNRSADAEKLVQIGLLSKMLEKGATAFVRDGYRGI